MTTIFFTIFAYCFSKTDFYMKKLIFLLCFPLVAGAQEVLSGRITDSLGVRYGIRGIKISD